MPQHITPQRSVPITSQNFTRVGIDAAARRLVSGEQFLARAKAADRLVDLAEAPGIDADPAEILHGIAEMRELPVQHRAHAVGADDEIAVAEIAMHQRHLLATARDRARAASAAPVRTPAAASRNCGIRARARQSPWPRVMRRSSGSFAQIQSVDAGQQRRRAGAPASAALAQIARRAKSCAAMVSPSTRCMMKPVPSSSCGRSTCITRGDGRPAS